MYSRASLIRIPNQETRLSVLSLSLSPSLSLPLSLSLELCMVSLELRDLSVRLSVICRAIISGISYIPANRLI